MPGQAPFHTDEHDLLLGYVAQQREVMRLTAYGLTDDQAREAAAPPSPLTVGGLIKHVTFVEQGWIDVILERERPATGEDDYADGFTMRRRRDPRRPVRRTPSRSGRRPSASCARSPTSVSGCRCPRACRGTRRTSTPGRYGGCLMHLVAETARHAGHADIVREAVDGATSFPLMAAAEGWPATPWMQPWEPA